jgi:hypothetical protein
MLTERAQKLLTTKGTFGQPAIDLGRLELALPKEEQFILRTLVRTDSIDFRIPPELEWLRETILECDRMQKDIGIYNPFVYVTVRHGNICTETDDEWHVDGFSMKVPHVPEQDYVWTNVHATEVLEQPITLPDDFDALKHNVHLYLQDVADGSHVKTLKEKHLYLIDPYVIHRRPVLPSSVHRTFFRISFVPIEIEDDTCTINPLIPRLQPYGNVDIRDTLTRYSV